MRFNKEVFHLNRPTTKHPSIYRGIVLAVISGIVFSTIGMMVKQMKNLHPGQVALYRFIGLFTMFMPGTVKSGQNPLGPKELRSILVLRGILGSLSIFLNYSAFRYLGLGEASVIIFSSPVFITILARIFFNEPCNIFQSIAVVLTVTGLIFTTKLLSRLTESPVAYSSENIYGLLAAIFAMFSVTLYQLLTRKLRRVPQSIINFNFSCLGILEIAILMLIFGNFQWPQCGTQRIYLLVLTLLSYVGQTLLVMALQCEYAGPVSTVRSASDIITSFAWQIFIFHDVPDLYGIIGAVLISVSIILVGLGKWLRCEEGNLFSCEKWK